MRIEGRARLTVRLYATETLVLQQLEKQGQKPSSLTRTALTRYLHDHYQPIYEEIYAANRRHNEELLKSYYARQAQQKAQTEQTIPHNCLPKTGNAPQKQTRKPYMARLY